MYKWMISFILTIGLLLSCQPKATILRVQNQSIEFNFWLNELGEPQYMVLHKEEILIDTSSFAFEFMDQPTFEKGLKILNYETSTVDESWEMIWGEQKTVINEYTELSIELYEKNSPHRNLNFYCRVYQDGIGIRYEFPIQDDRDSLYITEERTQFQLCEDHQCWWIPGDWDIYEHLYNTTKLSKINALKKANHPNLAQTYIPVNAVNTPVTMRTSEGLYLSFHEANLTNYAGMTLQVDTVNHLLTSNLVGSERTKYKVRRALPFHSPWRTIQIGETAGDLIESNLIVNLNDPDKLGTLEWFKPKKYMGIWWEMHIDKATWDYGMTRNADGGWSDTGQAHGRHGATTENTKKYIDFAAANNIGGILVEGWNIGWERWIGFEDREGVFDFVTPYPDYDLQEVVQYAKSKGVEMIMHHETSAAPRTYEKQLDTAFQLMNKLDIHAVKTGYVGKIIPQGEYHHGQWMVNHYRKVLETAATYQIAINAHEPIKATGIRRTFPNAISREGLRGQEFNAWASDGGNPPEHLSIVAFTRMLAGPIDFTPGVFELDLPTKDNNQINTTLAHQLALYVVLYSPIQMACDLPENYTNHPAFQFIRDVGVDWEKTQVLDGEIGDFVIIARQERDSQRWFVGGITDEIARGVNIDFDFLPDHTVYEAIIYQDAEDAHFRTNPGQYTIRNLSEKNNDQVSINMKEGGGFAMSIIPE